jgi:plasmid stability protein
MTLTINLPSATIEKLQAQAAATGKDVETFVREAVEAKLADKKRSFLEILKPLHDEVQESGITEEELDALIEQEIAAVRAKKGLRAAS